MQSILVVGFCFTLAACLIVFYCRAIITNWRSLSVSLWSEIRTVVIAITVIPSAAIVLRMTGVSTFVQQLFQVSICLCAAVGMLVQLVFAIFPTKMKVEGSDIAGYLFLIVMITALCDTVLYCLENLIPCSEIESNVTASFEVCDDASGPHGMCMSSHIQQTTVEGFCSERSLGPLRWPAANYHP